MCLPIPLIRQPNSDPYSCHRFNIGQQQLCHQHRSDTNQPVSEQPLISLIEGTCDYEFDIPSCDSIFGSEIPDRICTEERLDLPVWPITEPQEDLKLPEIVEPKESQIPYESPIFESQINETCNTPEIHHLTFKHILVD